MFHAPRPSHYFVALVVVVVAAVAAIVVVVDAVPRIATSSALESVQASDRLVLCCLLTKEKKVLILFTKLRKLQVEFSEPLATESATRMNTDPYFVSPQCLPTFT